MTTNPRGVEGGISARLLALIPEDPTDPSEVRDKVIDAISELVAEGALDASDGRAMADRLSARDPETLRRLRRELQGGETRGEEDEGSTWPRRQRKAGKRRARGEPAPADVGALIVRVLRMTHAKGTATAPAPEPSARSDALPRLDRTTRPEVLAILEHAPHLAGEVSALISTPAFRDSAALHAADRLSILKQLACFAGQPSGAAVARAVARMIASPHFLELAPGATDAERHQGRQRILKLAAALADVSVRGATPLQRDAAALSRDRLTATDTVWSFTTLMRPTLRVTVDESADPAAVSEAPRSAFGVQLAVATGTMPWTATQGALDERRLELSADVIPADDGPLGDRIPLKPRVEIRDLGSRSPSVSPETKLFVDARLAEMKRRGSPAFFMRSTDLLCAVAELLDLYAGAPTDYEGVKNATDGQVRNLEATYRAAYLGLVLREGRPPTGGELARQLRAQLGPNLAFDDPSGDVRAKLDEIFRRCQDADDVAPPPARLALELGAQHG